MEDVGLCSIDVLQAAVACLRDTYLEKCGAEKHAGCVVYSVSVSGGLKAMTTRYAVDVRRVLGSRNSR